jgi:hypothetical protein
MIVAAALFSRIRGWKPHGQFTLRRWGQVVNIIALAYGISSIINILWPRGEGGRILPETLGGVWTLCRSWVTRRALLN